MKKNMKKSAFLILCAAAFFAASCGNEAQNPKDTQSKTDTQTVTETAPVTEEELHDALPEMDFNDTTFRVWTEAETQSYFYSSQNTGEVVEDAVYKRNRAVEERFHIKLDIDVNDTSWRTGTERNAFQNSIMAGDGAYDLYSGVILYSMFFMPSGVFSDLSGSEYLSMTTPWWLQYLNDAMTVKGRQFQVCGYYEMPTLARTGVTYFNTTLINEFDLEDPYALVDSGEWTFDKLISMSKAVAADLNNDGNHDINDRYGLATVWDVIGLTFCGTGYQLYGKDTDGAVTLNAPNEFWYNANTMLYDLCTASTDLCFAAAHSYGGTRYADARQVFVENRALFYMQKLTEAALPELRDMGTYGIIPIPKYTEDQKEYGTHSSPFCSAIPTDVKDQTMSEVILEALAFESYKTVKPAYYDVALSTKYANDEKSKDMLDLIFRNIHVEPAYLYMQLNRPGGLEEAFEFLGVQEDYASYFASQEKNILQHIGNINDCFENLPG